MDIGTAQKVRRRRRDENTISPPVQTRLQFAGHFDFAFCILHFAFKLPAILFLNPLPLPLLVVSVLFVPYVPFPSLLFRVNSSYFEPIRANSSSRPPGGGHAANDFSPKNHQNPFFQPLEIHLVKKSQTPCPHPSPLANI
jgi:hypothetical protein